MAKIFRGRAFVLTYLPIICFSAVKTSWTRNLR